jgi:hypothetical protein
MCRTRSVCLPVRSSSGATLPPRQGSSGRRPRLAPFEVDCDAGHPRRKSGTTFFIACFTTFFIACLRMSWDICRGATSGPLLTLGASEMVWVDGVVK